MYVLKIENTECTIITILEGKIITILEGKIITILEGKIITLEGNINTVLRSMT